MFFSNKIKSIFSVSSLYYLKDYRSIYNRCIIGISFGDAYVCDNGVYMHINPYVDLIYQPIATKLGIRICLGGLYYMPHSVFRVFDLYDI